MMYDELISALREEAEWAEANEWETPITLSDHLKQAADAIEEQQSQIDGWIEQERKALLKSIPRWIKFVLRPLTEEEQREHPDWCYILDCHTPDDGQEILVSDGRYVWTDTFYQDGDQCYLDSDAELESCWWQPMPKSPKEE